MDFRNRPSRHHISSWQQDLSGMVWTMILTGVLRHAFHVSSLISVVWHCKDGGTLAKTSLAYQRMNVYHNIRAPLHHASSQPSLWTAPCGCHFPAAKVSGHEVLLYFNWLLHLMGWGNSNDWVGSCLIHGHLRASMLPISQFQVAYHPTGARSLLQICRQQLRSH